MIFTLFLGCFLKTPEAIVSPKIEKKENIQADIEANINIPKTEHTAIPQETDIQKIVVFGIDEIGVPDRTFLRTVANMITNSFEQFLDKEHYAIMDALILKEKLDSNQSCTSSGDCLFTNAQELKAKYFLKGTLTYNKGDYVINLVIYNSQTKVRTCASDNTITPHKQKSLIKEIPNLVQNLVQECDFGKRKVIIREPMVGYQEIELPPGSFNLGCTYDCYSNEQPSTPVQMPNTLSFMVHEVRQGFYDNVMGNDSTTTCLDCPVAEVSWEEAIQFVNTLSRKEKLEECYVKEESVIRLTSSECRGWRLPSEAEWEYAAKAGKDFLYSGSADPDTVSWNKSNSGGHSYPVGSKPGNAFGIFDMTGNVAEWIFDKYSRETFRSYAEKSLPIINPMYNPSYGSIRVIKGGGFNEKERRITYRKGMEPNQRSEMIGIRVVRTK